MIYKNKLFTNQNPHIFYVYYYANGSAGQTHLNPNTVRTLHDGVYLFPTD